MIESLLNTEDGVADDFEKRTPELSDLSGDLGSPFFHFEFPEGRGRESNVFEGAVEIRFRLGQKSRLTGFKFLEIQNILFFEEEMDLNEES